MNKKIVDKAITALKRFKETNFIEDLDNAEEKIRWLRMDKIRELNESLKGMGKKK